MQRKMDSSLHSGRCSSRVGDELAPVLEHVSNRSGKDGCPSEENDAIIDKTPFTRTLRPECSSHLSYVALRHSFGLSCQLAGLAAGSLLLDWSIQWLHRDVSPLQQWAFLYHDPWELLECRLSPETGLLLAFCEEAQTSLRFLHRLIDMHNQKSLCCGIGCLVYRIWGVPKQSFEEDKMAFVW